VLRSYSFSRLSFFFYLAGFFFILFFFFFFFRFVCLLFVVFACFRESEI